MEQTTEIKAESLQEPRGSEETVSKERNIPLKTDELFKKTLEANLRLIREGKLGSYQLIFSRSDGTYVLPCDIRVDKNGNPYIFIPPLRLAGREWVYVRKPQHGQHSFLNELVAFSSDNPTVREILNSIKEVTGEKGEDFIQNSPSLLGEREFRSYFQLEVDPSGNFWLVSEKEIPPAAAEKLGRLLGRLKAVGIEISGIKIGFEKETQRNISEEELKEANS